MKSGVLSLGGSVDPSGGVAVLGKDRVALVAYELELGTTGVRLVLGGGGSGSGVVLVVVEEL